jgi:Protein of unknown function (DUF2510)/HIRAN domain
MVASQVQCHRHGMHPGPAASAGWYPDPSGRHEHRFWSGTLWTEQVADSGEPSIDPLVEPLHPANVPPDWIERALWSQWANPANAIRGESQHQATISRLPGVTPGLVDDIRFEPVAVELIREPDNPYDRLACRALVAGNMVGHLSRECASILAPQVDAGGATSWIVCGAVVGGSVGATMYGVHVWLDRRLTKGPDWTLQPEPEESFSYIGPHLFGDVLGGGDRGYWHCTGEEFVAAVDHQCPTCGASPLQPCRTVQGNVSEAIHGSRLDLGVEAEQREAASLSASKGDAPAVLEGESPDHYRKRTGRYPPRWTSYRCRYQDALIEDARRTRNRAYLRRWGAT